MNLTITQDNSRTETINSTIIDRLYEIAFAASSDPNSTVSLTGNLYSPKGYTDKINWLNTNFSPNLVITVPTAGLYILFQDPAVEAALIAGGFSTDGVGVSLTDVTDATFTSSTFSGNTNIRSFPEFDLFTKANNNPPANLFYNCTNLTSIDLSNVTALSTSEFRNSGLSGEISLPNLTNLGSNAFQNCTRITSIDFTGSTFTSVPNLCFDGCSSLSKIILPTTVTHLNENWCRNIASSPYIEGLDNVTSHSNNNWNLYNKTILNPIKIGLLTGGSFIGISGNNKTTSIPMYYEPLRTETSVGKYITSYFYYQSLFLYGSSSSHVNIGLLYYKNITSFGHCTFAGCNITNLVINNNTPPVFVSNTDNNQVNLDYYSNWSDTPFGHLGSEAAATIGTLWVPDSAVSTYQADPLYSGWTIKGINTKTNGVDYDLPRYATYADWKTAEAAAVAQGGHAPQGLIEAWM